MNTIQKIVFLMIPLLFFEPLSARETVPVGEACKQSHNPLYVAIKTNTLYDLALVPNVGLEFYTGKGWSVSGSWVSAWWKNSKRNRFWRIYGLELGCRKYFGERLGASPLYGHHVGLYTQFATYDFELGGKGYIGGKPGCNIFEKMNYGVGLEYGYSLPVARRLNIDFSLGIGYFGGKRWEYRPQDNHYVWQSVCTKHWIGPTKAEVSLVWLVGKKNYNKGKGGR